MDTKGLEEGNTVTVQAVKDSPTKKLVILSGGAMMPNKEGIQKLNLLCEIDGRQKMWTPNKTTIRNLQGKLGYESSAWIGKLVGLSLTIIGGKEAVVGVPL